MQIEIYSVAIAILTLSLISILLYVHKLRSEIVRKELVIVGIKRKMRTQQAAMGKRESDILEQLQDSKIKPDVSITYFSELNENNGFFSKSKTVIIKGSILCNGLPIGSSFEVKRDTVKEVDVAKINQVLDDFAAPLIKAGIGVIANKHPLGKVLPKGKK